MRKSIINFFENKGRARVTQLKIKSKVNRLLNDEMNDLDYNPKTARHKSLKSIGLKPGKF